MHALNLPNLLTLMRLLLSPLIPNALAMGWNPIWFVWDTDYRIGIFALAVFLGCSDLLDGAFAKWLKQETPLGKRLDPLADFSYCLSLFIAVLFIYTGFPVLQICWILFAVYFGWYAQKVSRLRRSGKIGGPNMGAKIGMCVLMISMLLVIFGTFAAPIYVWHILAILGIIVSIILTLGALDAYQKTSACANCSCTKC
jgi:cardiolipin synthase